MLHAVMLMASVVLFNHMGLCDAVERVTHYKFRILSCSKCGTFWSVLAYLLFTSHNVIESFTAAFALSYLALWFELLLGLMSKVYETCIQTTEADSDKAGAESEMPEV